MMVDLHRGAQKQTGLGCMVPLFGVLDFMFILAPAFVP